MDTEFQKALESIDIETFLDRESVDYRLSYGTRGLQLNLRECPVCNEAGFKTYINAESGLGNCFHGSCGKRFNRFWLFKAVSNLSGAEFDSYVKEVAAQQGWMPKKERPKLVVADLELPSKTMPLPIDGCNLQYLQDRGVTLDSCVRFRLAYSDGWWGYKLADGVDKWVSYKGRVVIPILDLDGRMVSFQGRDVTGEQEPKYLFPVGFAVAGSHLYNGHSFINGKTEHAVVGEGVFDAIAVDQALRLRPDKFGNTLALATFGMHLSAGPDGQIAKFSLLKERGLKRVTFLWDGEGKATKMAVKAGLELLGLGLEVRIGRLPIGYDPAQGPDKAPTPKSLVLKAILSAEPLTRLSAIKIASKATVSGG